MTAEHIALIPAFQPGTLLPDLVRQAKEAGFFVLVVDDGSGAAFDAIFAACEPSATVLRYAENRGKGYALKTGLTWIARSVNTPYVVVTLDADGQHAIGDAVRICEEAAQRPGTLVLGSRELHNDAPRRSRLGNAFTRWLFRVSTRVRIQDTQTGLRAFSNDLVDQALSVAGSRYDYEMAALLACTRAGVPILEIPVETIYYADNSSSHYRTVRDSLLIARQFFAFALSSFSCFLLDYGLYALFLWLFGLMGNAAALTLANVSARLISATTNYTINRRLVFAHNGSPARSAAQYAALALGILAGNTLVLNLLVNAFSINSYLAKVLVEALFFIVSYLVQKHVIFRHTTPSKQDPAQGAGPATQHLVVSTHEQPAA